MKIGFDAKRAFCNSTGLGNYGRTLIKNFINLNQNHEYTLVSSSIGSDWPNIKEDIQRDAKYNIISSPLKNKIIESAWRTHLCSLNNSVQLLDIYHGLSNEIPYLLSSKIKKVVTIHDLIFIKHPNLYKYFDRISYKKKFFHAALSSDKIISISNQTTKDLIELFHVDENKIRTIYQTCHDQYKELLDENKIKDTLSKYNIKRPFLLNVGSIEERKNSLLIVKALNELKDSIDLDLVLIGKKTGYTSKIIQFVRENKLEERVHIIHNINFNDLPSFYQGSSIFIYPSFYEGFGIPIIEAIFSKVPVISATGSCLEEAGGPHSIYIDPNKHLELADSIKQIITNSTLKEEMVLKSYEYALLNFSNEVTAKNLNKVYEELFY